MKALSKKMVDNFNYHPTIMPASRKLAKIGAYYAAQTAIFKTIIRNLEPHLKWQINPHFVKNADDIICEQSCFCELIGPDGMSLHDTVRIGLLLILPQTEFPAHLQAASESIFILSGKVSVSHKTQSARSFDAGSTLFHASFDTYGWRTAALPMLAIYAWTGEIHQPSLLA